MRYVIKSLVRDTSKISFALIFIMRSLAALILIWFFIGSGAKILIEEIQRIAEGIGNFGRISYIENFDQFTSYPNSVAYQIIVDGFLTVPELIIKYGYPMEVHTVQTPDGYLLDMHRIPKYGAVPVFLQHGIMDSSGAWVIMGPQTSLAYQLADLGYDVWMGNVRGNRYSRRHINLNPNKKEFWDFSFHEIGVFDVPAMLDYIIETTGYSKLHYVGHSQGTTIFWIMCSERPIYCEKILSMNALAPVAFMTHTKSPLIRSIAPFLNQMEFLLKMLGMYEFMPHNDLLTMGGQLLCKKEAITQILCMNAIFLVAGYDSDQLNKTMLPAIMGHVPAGSATKQIIHYGQLINSRMFRQFDYGWFRNILKYGSVKPPNYDFSNVRVPVVLHHSENDWLAQPADVEELEQRLPSVVRSYLIPKFNHLDFIFAINSREMVNDGVIQIIRDFEIFMNSV